VTSGSHPRSGAGWDPAVRRPASSHFRAAPHSGVETMSSTQSLGTRQPRVRHQARDAVVLMTFSAVTSVGLAGCLMVLSGLGR